MKALKTGAVVLLGMVLAAPVWGHPNNEVKARIYDRGLFQNPNDPEMHERLVCPEPSGHDPANRLLSVEPWSADLRKLVIRADVPDTTLPAHAFYIIYQHLPTDNHPTDSFINIYRLDLSHTEQSGTEWSLFTPRLANNREYVVVAYRDLRRGFEISLPGCEHLHATIGTVPSPPEPEPPAPPPEPEPPSPPEPEPPEPEEPDPEEPDHTHPVERCDHIAIVPAMPRALTGDEGSPDHWLRISNLGAASINFAITGLDEGGTKAGTYRRELPASRIVRVKMRDVEAAFDVEPEGWWRLVVTGSGPLEVVATMRQGAERRFVPVRTPATCPGGPVTRTGG